MNLSHPPFLQKHLFILVHIKGLLAGGFSKRSYSQWGEDIVLQKIFTALKNGFYVDVGAYHPFHYSNTYLLYKKGWRGVNVDSNHSSIALFNWHRPRDINLNYGVLSKVTSKPYYVFNHQSCNTFSEEQKEKMLKKSYISLIDTKSVPCMPLQHMLDTHAPGRAIDFLNVDVEGANFEVLQTLDLQRVAPRVICIEDDDFNFTPPSGRSSTICQLLSKSGYSLHSKIGPSCIYVRE